VSSPPNPLDQYQSHSYHFILLASNNTESLKTIVADNFLSHVVGAKLGSEIKKDSGAYLIFDTRTTSEFTVDGLNFDVYLANSSGSDQSNSESLTTMINMRVTDPSGVGFYNYMYYLMNEKFQTDFTGLTFLLHIMFIGHTDDGRTIPLTEYNVSIPLIMMETFNLAEFGSKGGVYDLAFAPGNMGAPQRIESYSSLFQNFQISGKDGLLGNMIQTFENQLNTVNKEWYLKFNPKFTQSDGTPSDSRTVDQISKDEPPKNGRLVQYMITIPPSWFYFEMPTTPENVIERNWKEIIDSKTAEAQPTTEKSTEQKHDTYHSLSADMKIEDAITSILRVVPEVNALANMEAKHNNAVKMFKIVSSITSNTETVLIHYDVVEYDIPNVNKDKVVADSAYKDNTPTRDNTQGPNSVVNETNSIEFDYVFSGKNTDILDMEIKANNLFLGLTTSGMFGQLARDTVIPADQKAKNNTPEIPEKELYAKVGKYQPLSSPPWSKDQFDNFGKWQNNNQPGIEKRIKDSQEMRHSLSDLHITSMDVEVKIRGNPRLFGRYIVKELTPHVALAGGLKNYLNIGDYNKATAWEYGADLKLSAKNGNPVIANHIDHRKYVDSIVKANQDEINKGQETAKSNPSFIAAGTWVKINIYGPADYPFQQEDVNGNFKIQLFYDSWYFVSSVSNSFDRGLFTQTLHLKAFDLYGKVGQSNKEKMGNT
jgi:hypothetical protein